MKLKAHRNAGFKAAVTVLAAISLFPFLRSSRDVVNIDAGAFREVFSADDAVLDLLSDALKRNPDANEFRIRYTTYRGGGRIFEADLDYNRREKRVGERSHRSGADYRYFYFGATDADIYKVAWEGGNISNIKDNAKITFGMQRDYLSGLKFRIFNR